jgi:CAAX prenyl protease-like protein
MAQTESSPEAGAGGEAPSVTGPASVWPYVLPLAGFLALTALEAYLPAAANGAPSPRWYPPAYTLKMVVVLGLLWHGRAIFRDLRPWPGLAGSCLAIGLGLLVTAAWVGLEGHYPEFPGLGKRAAFDPGALPLASRLMFLAVRLFGLVVVVPLVEELFYRAFLMRWIIEPEFTKVPIGRLTVRNVVVTTAVFGLSHPEWLPAVLTGLAWAWLVGQTKSVSACVLSHAVANLALGIYVLSTHEWKYW